MHRKNTEITIIIPPIASNEIELDLVKLTEYLTKKVFKGQWQGGGLLGGEYGYGVDYRNDVFEMRPYCWEACSCGWDEMEFNEPHSENCYQSLVEKELKKYGWKKDKFGFLDSPKRMTYSESEKIQDKVYKKYCKKFGLTFPEGCAVHCTCEHEYNFKKWFEKNKKGKNGHADDCVLELPNFKHYKSGLEIRWYKFIGRSMEYSWHQPRIFESESDRRDAMDGILMSDGNIDLAKSRSKNIRKQRPINAKFQMTSKSKEFCEFVSRILPTKFKITGPHKATYQNNGISYYYLLRSLNDKYYNDFRDRWYKNGKKIIPNDININPTVILFEYLGDGCLVNPKKERQYCKLCTYGFEKKNNEIIANGLKRIGIKTKFAIRNDIIIKKDSVNDFLNWIGDCPVNDYKHKWAYRRYKKYNKRPSKKEWSKIFKEVINSIH